MQITGLALIQNLVIGGACLFTLHFVLHQTRLKSQKQIIFQRGEWRRDSQIFSRRVTFVIL